VDDVRVGQWALALGKTYDGDMPSISVGIVSALQRIWGKAIQTDAKVSPVNYGGPLVDIQGRVLGVLVPLSPQATGDVAGVEWYDSGIGFAIPLADVYARLDRMKSGTDLLPGLLGVSVKSRDIYEGQPTLDRVRTGSPAQKAGLEPGDQLLELDGQKIVRQAQVLHVLGNKYAGDKLAVVVKRGDQNIFAELTLVDHLEAYESAFLGILPQRRTDSTPAAATDADPGIEVRFVYPDSPAAAAGIERGDRILEWNGEALPSTTDLLDRVSRARPEDKVKLGIQQDRKNRQVEISLARLPETVPAELHTVAIAPGEPGALEEGLHIGRFNDRVPAHDREYWAYVPDHYNPRARYALLVWLHPGGDTMEAALLRSWQSLCDERGIILLAPKARQIAGWTPDDLEFIKELVEQFSGLYAIDRSRVVVHGLGNSGQFANLLAFKHRDLIHGVATINAPLKAIPIENEPESRLQFYLLAEKSDAALPAVKQTADGLRKLRFPVIFTEFQGTDLKYPSAEIIRALARWIDSLDRI